MRRKTETSGLLSVSTISLVTSEEPDTTAKFYRGHLQETSEKYRLTSSIDLCKIKEKIKQKLPKQKKK